MITVDATSQGIDATYAGTTTLTFSHTVGSGASKLVVCVQLWQDVAGTGTVSGITFNSVALTKAKEYRFTGSGMQTEIWYLDAPASGAHNVVVSVSGATDSRKAGSISLFGTASGVDTSSSTDGGSATAAALSPSLTPSEANCIVIDCLESYGGTNAVQSQTSFFEDTTGSINAAAQYVIQTSAAATTMSWSWTTAGDYSHCGISFKSGVTSSLEQEGYRFRNDDGNETGATWAAAQDTLLGKAKNLAIRLRIILNATGDIAAQTFRLEYRRKNYNRPWRKVLGTAAALGHTLVGTPTRTNITASPGEFDYVVPEGATLLVLTMVSDGSGTAALRQGTSGFGTVLTPVFGGKVLTQGNSTKGGATGYETACELWYLLNPPIGTHTMSIPNSRPNTVHCVISTFKAAEGYTSALDDNDSGQNTASANPTATSTPTVDGGVIVAVCGSGRSTLPSARTGTSLFETLTASTRQDDHQYYLQATAAAFAMTWTISSDDWCVVACAFKCVAVTEEIQLLASTNIAVSGENTTYQLTPPSGKTGAADFQAGRMQDDENPADSVDLAADKYTEMEWCVKATDNA